MIDTLDKAIIVALQNDFPVTARPYHDIAERLGISETELLERIRHYQHMGYIRKMGAVLRHREVGFTANVMCVWQAPEDKVDEIGRMFASHPAVSHCYARPAFPQWPHNLYTMIHGLSPTQCETYVKELVELSGIDSYKLLYSMRELKKSSMRYFEEEAAE
jgi:siroheme decarboxylase